MRVRSATEVTSARMASVSPPISAARFSSLAGSVPVMATLAPFSRNSLAVASPMPLDPPVISAFFP